MVLPSLDDFKETLFAEDVPNMTTMFDRSTKLTFRNPGVSSYIKFGSIRDTDVARNVRGGVLTLPGATVEGFFEPSIRTILEAVQQIRTECIRPVTIVYLVGGFAASDWLYQRLQDGIKAMGLNLYRPDSHMNKAVADGAVSYFLDHFVDKRVAKHFYGAVANVHYDSSKKAHQIRSGNVVVRRSGARMLPGVFETMVARGTQVTETQEFRRKYYREASTPKELCSISADIKCYKGKTKKPEWIDAEPAMFSTLCRVEADTTTAPKVQQGSKKAAFYKLDYEVILLFGPTELKAQIAWNENGLEKRSPATIVYVD